ncbi:MAG: hypothetical protein ABFC12_04445 [Methanobacterium sp.]
MDDNGFIFTLDAVLALIPVFIILIAVSSVDQGSLILPSQQIRLSHQAQDALDAMGQYHTSEDTLIEEMVTVLKTNGNNAAGIAGAGELAGSYLDNNLQGMNYKLVELNHLNGETIISKGKVEDAPNVAVGTKNHGDYCFKLYVWDLS